MERLHGSHADFRCQRGRGCLFDGFVLADHPASLARSQSLGGFFRRRHILEHHRIYSARRLVSSEYSAVERSLTPYYVLPAGTLIALLGVVLPLAPFVSFTTTLLISFGAHAYIHKHYHLQYSWLARSRWFRRHRELHYVHHRDARRNYAVIDLFWDRLFGTFAEAPTNTDSAK